MKQKTCSPDIVLTGRVYVDKLLALEHEHLPRLRTARCGDIKLIAVPKGPPCECSQYVGFFAAYVFDENRWRKFALRGDAATPSTYESVAERSRNVHQAVKALKKLKGRQCKFLTPAYEVKPATATSHSVPESASADQPALGTQSGQSQGGKKRGTNFGQQSFFD